ncbi:MAG TPA: hypothetical protein VGD43_07850 [Micromonospora sp.]
MQPGYPGQDPYGQQPPSQDPYAQPYGQPTSGQPAYGQPTSGQPYGQPTSGQPYGHPTSGQPYGQPAYGQPEQPYGGSTYGQPQYQQDPYAPQPTSGQPFGAAPGYPAATYGAPAQGQNNTLGLLSMILGIAAIPLLCCFNIGILVGIAAAVLGVLGKQKADQGLASNRGQAMAGLICGVVAVGLGILAIIASVALNMSVPGYY